MPKSVRRPAFTAVSPRFQPTPAKDARRSGTAASRAGCAADDYTGRLVVSELVTNALLHGDGPIVVRLFQDARDGMVVIEIWDGGEGRPLVQPEDHTATSGRGLRMVSSLAQAWGTRPLLEGGKITWARCRL